METESGFRKSKGGRPKKKVKRDQQLAVMCTVIERKVIENKARETGLTLSEYLRKMGLSGKIDRYKNELIREFLQCSGKLSHLAANCNQIARKRNREDPLDPLERSQWQVMAKQVKELVGELKTFMYDRNGSHR